MDRYVKNVLISISFKSNLSTLINIRNRPKIRKIFLDQMKSAW